MSPSQSQPTFNLDEKFQYRVSSPSRDTGIHFEPRVILGISANMLEALGQKELAESIWKILDDHEESSLSG